MTAFPRAVRLSAFLAAAAVAVTTTLAAPQAQTRPRAGATPSAGAGTFYVGTYKGTIAIVDEATEKVTGEIPVSVGIPGRVAFSADRTKMYVEDISYEKVELIDRATHASLGTYVLSAGAVKTRIWSMQPDPLDRYLILVIKNYEQKTDRWEVGPPTLVQYDLATKTIARTIPWPKGEEREGVGVLFSPDGKLLYLLGPDILIYETTTFTEVDRWELSRPIESGAGRVSLGGLDPFSDQPGFFTGLFTMRDALQNRSIMGLGRIDLANKHIDFHPIGPSRGLSFALAPDRKKAYGLWRDIGEAEFWAFDLETYRVVSRTSFPGRPRMSLKVSSRGNYLYIYTAGNTIDLYDATTFKYQRTITLDGDMTSLTLLPPAAPSR